MATKIHPTKELLISTTVTLLDTKLPGEIAVDEILEHCYEVMKPFWQEVKQEIEKL